MKDGQEKGCHPSGMEKKQKGGCGDIPSKDRDGKMGDEGASDTYQGLESTYGSSKTREQDKSIFDHTSGQSSLPVSEALQSSLPLPKDGQKRSSTGLSTTLGVESTLSAEAPKKKRTLPAAWSQHKDAKEQRKQLGPTAHENMLYRKKHGEKMKKRTQERKALELEREKGMHQGIAKGRKQSKDEDCQGCEECDPYSPLQA